MQQPHLASWYAVRPPIASIFAPSSASLAFFSALLSALSFLTLSTSCVKRWKSVVTCRAFRRDFYLHKCTNATNRNSTHLSYSPHTHALFLSGFGTIFGAAMCSALRVFFPFFFAFALALLLLDAVALPFATTIAMIMPLDSFNDLSTTMQIGTRT